MIIVKHLLPSEKREEQDVAERDRFLDIRRHFLADGSFSLISHMLSLLACGKHIALNSGNSGSAFWSADKTVFYLHGKPVVVRKFQLMAQSLLAELEDMLWGELLWVADPEQRFNIRLDLIQD